MIICTIERQFRGRAHGDDGVVWLANGKVEFMFTKAFIPYGGYYSSPFVRWQGSIANVHSLPLGAATAKKWMAEKGIDPGIIDYVNFGSTVEQPRIFFGGPWAAALIGADGVPGIWISQACSTSTTAVYQAAMALEVGSAGTVFNLMVDRLSNGCLLYTSDAADDLLCVDLGGR